MEQNRWHGKVALVTGASSGIGAAIAERCYELGLRVVLAARRRERLQALAERVAPIVAERDERLLPLSLDVSREESVVGAFRQIIDHWGGVDVLINNAGLGYEAPLVDGETQLWREMLDVNVLGLCWCTREAVRDLRRRGAEGHIVHISSLSAYRATTGGGIYAATKAAVRSLAESLRRELHELKLPIRVSSVSPGFVETEFHARFFDDEQRAQERYSQYKTLEPEDIADAVAYALCTPPHVQVHDILVRPTAQAT